jgi:PIN domain nuclease of toxin-antitoxin system
LQADPDALVAAIDDSGFIELPVRAVHAAGVAKLPGLHKDPFDRLLIAQSVAEPLRFLTADTALKAYGDLVAVAD